MSPNSDNAVARFLFAILKQKNLKDIDWNRVAQDPVLLQPISNGHAARMRYFRFRATVTGSDGRVTKSRSHERARGSKSKSRKSSSSAASDQSDIPVKQEFPQQGPLSLYSPASTTSPYLPDNLEFESRFLTPCSEDMATPFSVNPAAVEKQSRHSLPGFSPPAGFADSPDNMYSPAFSTFDNSPFGMEDFPVDATVRPDMATHLSTEDCIDHFDGHF